MHQYLLLTVLCTIYLHITSFFCYNLPFKYMPIYISNICVSAPYTNSPVLISSPLITSSVLSQLEPDVVNMYLVAW